MTIVFTLKIMKYVKNNWTNAKSIEMNKRIFRLLKYGQILNLGKRAKHRIKFFFFLYLMQHSKTLFSTPFLQYTIIWNINSFIYSQWVQLSFFFLFISSSSSSPIKEMTKEILWVPERKNTWIISPFCNVVCVY